MTKAERDFINFFAINPEIEQAKQIEYKENKTMRKTNTKTNNKEKVDNNKVARKPLGNKIKVEGGFELKNDIPLPEEKSRKGVKSPFTKTVEVMSVGQYFDTKEVPKSRYGLEKRLGVKLFIQKSKDNFRVWRKK